MNELSAALRGPLPAEVTFGATVLSAPHVFVGSHTHARHEAFACRSDDGVRVEIVDNIDLAPPVAVAPGDRITVRGELVADRDGPVVHWTHHDPRGHHPDGWIEAGGRRYA